MGWTSKATPFAAGTGATAAAAVVPIPFLASSFSSSPTPMADGGPKEATPAKSDLSIAPDATVAVPAEAGPASSPQSEPPRASVTDLGIAAAATDLFVPPTSSIGPAATGTQPLAGAGSPTQPILSFGLGGTISMEMLAASGTALPGTSSTAQSTSAGAVLDPGPGARILSVTSRDTPLTGSDPGALGLRSSSMDQATAVPEPAALMLFGVGVPGLVWVRRRCGGMRRKPARAATSLPYRTGESEAWLGC